ncbi:MAG: S8 family serine peptidase, partial [Erythrobacter sp.]|nr:S8 family serine peptidase [Erythrobacter sp.]
NGNQFVTLFSGTSFSAPQVAGAVALLAQAFPNLTGAQIVEILLDTARDAGATGTDATYGRGILDIGRAVAPQGTTRLPGTTVALVLSDDTGTASAAMGDALSGQSLSAVLLDKYERAYSYDMGSRLRTASLMPRLEGAIQQSGRRIDLGNDRISMAFTVDASGPIPWANGAAPLRLSQEDARLARVLAGQAALRVSQDTQFGLAYSQSVDGIAAHLRGQRRPAFLIAGDASGDTGFLKAETGSVALRHELGDFGLTFTASSGKALLGQQRRTADFLARERERYGMERLGISADRRMGPVHAVIGVDYLHEQRTVLGGHFHEAFGANGADSLFLDSTLGIDLAPNWWLGAQGRQGITRARSAGLVEGSNLISSAWSLDLMRQGFLQSGDSFGFRLSQPLRVESGGLTLNLPVSYDYATQSADFATRRLNLAPNGREIMAEIAWRGSALGGNLAASAFYRRDPGHRADIANDGGLVVRWIREF